MSSQTVSQVPDRVIGSSTGFAQVRSITGRSFILRRWGVGPINRVVQLVFIQSDSLV